MTEVALQDEAVARLLQLGLTTEMLQRTLLRADAETKMVTGLEPPTSEGSTRYFKTVRYLREEVVPLEWGYDNSKNFCRTVHPSGEFSIVTSSGDEHTGVYTEGRSPTTKYPKGDVTAMAVQVNAGQFVLDLGEDYDIAEPQGPIESIWFLMQRVTADTIFAELSLPTKIEGGLIQEWEERIILDPIDRNDPLPTGDVQDPPDAGAGDYSVEVSAR
ncbi:hypothetical protein [Nocardioides lijunqiniae]|uniref:hypothetical protein n=1 Tax=Nocardioides lijunqiniae TaxID=2760832 RepID=UPI001877F83D|nr:hypothetical protein [Nocardioides lijunqiniae]